MWMWGKETMGHVLFECDRYEKFRRDRKGFLHQERESGLESIWGYKRASGRLEQVTLSMLGASGRKEKLREGKGEGTRVIIKDINNQACFFVFFISTFYFLFLAPFLFLFQYYSLLFILDSFINVHKSI